MTKPTFFLICALSVAASAAQAQEYGFQFMTTTPGFSGELFFNAPSGAEPETAGLVGNFFITTPDGTFTAASSTLGGPVGFPAPTAVWSPDGITTLDLVMYKDIGSQPYDWTATPTSISDGEVGGIPEDPSASGTWVYVGVVPEPDAMLLMVLGAGVMAIRAIRQNKPTR